MTDQRTTPSECLHTMAAAFEHVALQCRTLAAMGWPGNANVKTLGEHMADAGIPAGLSGDSLKTPELAKADKAARKAAKAKAEEPAPAPAAENPDKILNQLKTKLVALVGTKRAEAIRILGSVGAKKISDVPPAKYGELLAMVEKALAPAEDDPLA